MSVWFFEEQKHSLVLMEYLRRFRPDLVPTEAELHAVRFDFDPAPALETLMLHFCGEIRLNHWYRRAAEWHNEPVIKAIYETLARDEARHGGAYLRYMKRAMQQVRRRGARRVRQGRRADGQRAPHGAGAASDQPARQRRAVPARHDPEPPARTRSGSSTGSTRQIQFDSVWESKVVERILHNLSLLMERSFASVQELNRYRKEVTAAVAAAAAAAAAAAVVPVGADGQPA